VLQEQGETSRGNGMVSCDGAAAAAAPSGTWAREPSASSSAGGQAAPRHGSLGTVGHLLAADCRDPCPRGTPLSGRGGPSGGPGTFRRGPANRDFCKLAGASRRNTMARPAGVLGWTTKESSMTARTQLLPTLALTATTAWSSAQIGAARTTTALVATTTGGGPPSESPSSRLYRGWFALQERPKPGQCAVG